MKSNKTITLHSPKVVEGFLFLSVLGQKPVLRGGDFLINENTIIEVGGADKSFNDPEDEEYEHIHQWMGEDFDPCFFDIRGARRRVDDFQRIIGEARWGFYRQ